LHGPRQNRARRLFILPNAADTKDMLPTWIFQRGGEHLILNCRENARGVTLIVSGDGDLRSYSFHDFAALVKFEGQMAEFLLQTGWAPAQLTIEPRAIPNHRASRPGGSMSII